MPAVKSRTDTLQHQSRQTAQSYNLPYFTPKIAPNWPVLHPKLKTIEIAAGLVYILPNTGDLFKTLEKQ